MQKQSKDPLKYRLTKQHRNLIMLFLILTFFISTPIIVLYTAGYRYDFSIGKIKQTGVLSIDVKPKNTQVYLNNILIEKKTPIKLPNRAPGHYNLKIEKNGYHTWEREIFINSNQTTYIKDLTLFKNSLPEPMLEKFSSAENIEIYKKPDNPYLLVLTKNKNIYELYAYNVNNELQTLLIRSQSDESPQINLANNHNNGFIATKIDNEITYQLFSLDTLNKTKNYSFNSNDYLNYQWDKNFAYLYLKNKNFITRLSFDSQETEYKKNPEEIWYIDENNDLWTVKNNEFYLNEEKINYFYEKTIEKIIDKNDQRLIAKTNDSQIVIIKIDDNKNFTETSELSSQNYEAYQDNNYLVWSDWELWKIGQSAEKELLIRSGDKIKQVMPLDNLGNIFIVAENSLIGFNPGYYTKNTLFEGVQAEMIKADFKNRKVFFTGSIGKNQGLFELEY